MSDFSDRLRAILTPQSVEEAMTRLRQMTDTPGFKEYSKYSHQKMIDTIREAKLHFNGVSWKDGHEAVNRTSDYLQPRILSKMIELFSMGLLMGSDETLQHHSDYQVLFESDVFQTQAMFKALEVACDVEARNELVHFLAALFAGTGRAIGILEATGSEANHIWDVWYHSIGNTCQALYLAGFQLGTQEREAEILRGIELATRSQE